MATPAATGFGLSPEPPEGFRGAWRVDENARAVYSEAAGIARIIPRAVAVPLDADDVVTLVRWAGAMEIPLTPRGSGSSMGGGAIGGGVVMDLSRMRAQSAIDPTTKTVWVEAGVLRDDVEYAAREIGLRFPVDPSSGAFCTVGGMLATNAAGAHTLRFGSAREWVRAIDCVFADGSRATIRRAAPLRRGIPAIDGFLSLMGRQAAPEHRRVRKSSSGYHAPVPDLVDLLVGSEGTIAVIVGAELMLADVPGATSSLLAAFPSLEGAAAGAAAARESDAAACELLDRTFVDIAREGGSRAAAGIPPGTEAVLLVEVEAATAVEATALVSAMARRLDEAGASITSIALSDADEQHLWSLRHAASPMLARLDPALKSMQFIEDGAVPTERLADYIRGVRAALERAGVRGVIFGHAGDAHIHVNPLIDVRLPDWRARIEALFEEVCGLTTSLGGTLTGEHGDGRLRTPVLGAVLGEASAQWVASVKDAFDPRRILNPGVKEPLVGQRPIEQVKYDPTLPPLPLRARAALDLIAEQRGYAEFRLSLVGEPASDPATPGERRPDPY